MRIMKMMPIILSMSIAVGMGACSKAEGVKEPVGTVKESSNPQGQVTNISNISNNELQDLLAKGITLVDIRLPEEWQQTGVIQGSKLLTLFDKSGAVAPDFLPNLQKIAPMNKPVALICRTGNRTRVGTAMLAQAGYTQVYNVTNGISGWLQAGKPVVHQ